MQKYIITNKHRIHQGVFSKNSKFKFKQGKNGIILAYTEHSTYSWLQITELEGVLNIS